MTGVEIVEVDPFDEPLLREFWEVEQRIGRALHDEVDRRRLAAGRHTVVGEVNAPPGADLADVPATAFAQALGFGSVHVEHHLRLASPVADDGTARVRALVGDRAAAYDVVTWGNRCPEEYVEPFCAMQTQMSSDVPSGDLDLDTVIHDEARLRSDEERMARSYDAVVAVARRRSDGVFGGYSVLYLPHGGDDYAHQDDTLVMPDHRGHRLGTVLKLATLDVVTREHPACTSIHTWTSPGNDAMYRTNTDFGFEVVEVMHEMQRKDA